MAQQQVVMEALEKELEVQHQQYAQELMDMYILMDQILHHLEKKYVQQKGLQKHHQIHQVLVQLEQVQQEQMVPVVEVQDQ